MNADEIARGLSPLNPGHTALAAGRLMLGRMRELIRSRQSFAFETTCAGRAYLPMLTQCKADGWRVTLVFLWLPSPKDAVDRVAGRVQRGGHNIPSDVVIRRYWAGLSNMRLLYLRWRMQRVFMIIRRTGHIDRGTIGEYFSRRTRCWPLGSN